MGTGVVFDGRALLGFGDWFADFSPSEVAIRLPQPIPVGVFSMLAGSLNGRSGMLQVNGEERFIVTMKCKLSSDCCTLIFEDSV